MKLALGTAQFGMHYGVTNINGRPSREEIGKILEKSALEGIDTIDTARLYADSESVLGGLSPQVSKFDIFTKTTKVNSSSVGSSDIEKIKRNIDVSFEMLDGLRVHGLLLHNGSDLLLKNGEKLFDVLANLKSEGLISKIGVSAYFSDEIFKIIDEFPIDVVQIPLSVLDQRPINSGLLEIMSSKGIAVHVRSVFLQGILLSSPNEVPARFNPIAATIEEIDGLAKDLGVTRASILFDFVKKNELIDKVIIGVNSTFELEECLLAFKNEVHSSIDYSRYSCSIEKIINPSLW